MDQGPPFQPRQRRTASSFGSVLSPGPVDDVTGSDQATSVLLYYDAYTVAATWDNEILKKNKEATIYIGIFLKALQPLLDNASEKPVDPQPEVGTAMYSSRNQGRTCSKQDQRGSFDVAAKHGVSKYVELIYDEDESLSYGFSRTVKTVVSVRTATPSEEQAEA